MFRLGEIVKAVDGQLLSGNPQLRINGVSIDSRSIRREELFITIKGSRFDGHNFIREAIKKGARAVIFSHKFPLRPKKIIRGLIDNVGFIAVQDTRKALGKLAYFHRHRFNIPVVAITGSNGKTTTKDMLVRVLSSRAKVLKNPGTQNNDIGVPLALLRLDISHDIVVLELGTNHFGEIAYLVNIAQPNFGVITNIGPAHLEYLKNLAGVYKEKISLLKDLKPPKIAILNADEPWLERFKNGKKAFIITYGIKNKSDFYATEIKLTKRGTLKFFVNPAPSYLRPMLPNRRGKVDSNRQRKIELNTIGYANIYNALAAIAVCRLLGWDYKSISQRLATYVFPPGRLKAIKLNGIPFIDDTYNANPASLSEALGVLSKFRVDGRKIFVMGDMLELGKRAMEFHRRAGIQIARVCDAFISVGRFSQFAARWACKSGLDKDCVFSCQDSQKAGNLLFKTLKPDRRDLILVKGSRLMKMERVLKPRP
jgi:UDP-N-acetylmuramoyl-tripeptide--D-alanyl-D-alanine ligase